MKKKIIMGLVVVLVSITSFISAHTGNDDYLSNSMMGGIYGTNFMWGFGIIFVGLVFIILILLIVLLIKQNAKWR